MLRQAAKAVKKEKLIISEDLATGKWTLKSESTFKNTAYEFTPGVEFNELRADGVEVKVSSFSLYRLRSSDHFS